MNENENKQREELYLKVMEGLESCTLRNSDDKPRCRDCKYNGACLNRLKIDAYNLLKEQHRIIEEYKKYDGFLWAHGFFRGPNDNIEYKMPTVASSGYGTIIDNQDLNNFNTHGTINLNPGYVTRIPIINS